MHASDPPSLAGDEQDLERAGTVRAARRVRERLRAYVVRILADGRAAAGERSE